MNLKNERIVACNCIILDEILVNIKEEGNQSGIYFKHTNKKEDYDSIT